MVNWYTTLPVDHCSGERARLPLGLEFLQRQRQGDLDDQRLGDLAPVGASRQFAQLVPCLLQLLQDGGVEIKRGFQPFTRGDGWRMGLLVYWLTSMLASRRLTEEVAEDVGCGLPWGHA
jgi:hypothetical protein